MVMSFSDWFLTHNFMWKKFDAKRSLRISRRVVGRVGAKRAILFYSYWTGNSRIYARLAGKFPDSTLVFFDYPNEVMSEDVGVSLKYINELLSSSVSIIKKLRSQGVEDVVLVGSSFGSNIAFKLSTMVKVEKVVLNMIDINVAKAIFTSPAMIILRNKLLRHGFTLHKLDKIYDFLSFDDHLEKVKSRKTKFLLLLSRTDIFTPYKKFKSTLRRMNSLGINYSLSVNRFMGHVLSIYYNVLLSCRIIDFIED